MSCTSDIVFLVFDSIRGTSSTWTSYALFTWEIDSRQFLKDTYCYHFFINIIFSVKKNFFTQSSRTLRKYCKY